MPNDKISILMPCYNTEPFIEKALDSILAQTYQNWELIAVNDGSTDNTIEILHTYQKKDNRIIVIDKERSGCAAPNANIALEHATGDFIFRCDSDDWLSPDLLEKLMERQNETEADIVLPDLCFVHDDSFKTWTMIGIVKSWGKTPDDEDRSSILSGKEALRLSVFWNIHGVAMCKASIIQKQRYCEEGMNGDEFSSRMFFYLANKVAFSEGTYFYRQHSNSITKKVSPRFFDTYKTSYKLEKFLIENKFEPKLISKLNKHRFSQFNYHVKMFNRFYSQFNEKEKRCISAMIEEERSLLKSFYTLQDYFFRKETINSVKYLIIFHFIRIKYKKIRYSQ